MASRRATRLVRAGTTWNRISADHNGSNVRDQTVGADRDNRTLSTLPANLRCGGSDSQAARGLWPITIALRATLPAGAARLGDLEYVSPAELALANHPDREGSCGRDGPRIS